MKRRQGLWKALILVTAALPLAASARLSAKDLTLSGRVLDDRGGPVQFVHLSIESNGKRVFDQEVQLSANGDLRVTAESAEADLLRCSIGAPGFEQKQITAVVQGNRALLGTVMLRRYLEIGLAKVLDYADGQHVNVDFWVTSHTKRSLIVQGIVVSAPGPKNSPCAAPAPLLTLQFDSIAIPDFQPHITAEKPIAATLHIRQDSLAESPHAYRVAGSYRYDPCGPTTLKVAVPYSFTLDAADQDSPRRIRLELPLKISVGHSDVVRPEWRNASLRVVLDGGETIDARSESKQ
jgi:hypothetical protein